MNGATHHPLTHPDVRPEGWGIVLRCHDRDASTLNPMAAYLEIGSGSTQGSGSPCKCSHTRYTPVNSSVMHCTSQRQGNLASHLHLSISIPCTPTQQQSDLRDSGFSVTAEDGPNPYLTKLHKPCAMPFNDAFSRIVLGLGVVTVRWPRHSPFRSGFGHIFSALSKGQ